MPKDYTNPFTATLQGIVNSFKKSKPIGTLKDSDRIDEKNCLVTGANSGLGFAIAIELAKRGGNVYMACRSGIPEAGENVKRIANSERVTMLKVDLSDIDSIVNLSEEIKILELVFDIVICNAAVVPSGSRKTKQGFDEMFTVNYLAKYILLNLLWGNQSISMDGRIILVSSESHRSSPDLDLEKFGQFAEYKMSKVVALYGYYKLALLTFATEFSKKINKKSKVHAICPGAVNSNIAKEAPKIFMPLLKVIFGIFFQKPAKAALPVIYLACSPEIENRDNIYLHMWTEKEMDKRAVDPGLGEKLWHKTNELVKQAGYAYSSQFDG